MATKLFAIQKAEHILTHFPFVICYCFGENEKINQIIVDSLQLFH